MEATKQQPEESLKKVLALAQDNIGREPLGTLVRALQHDLKKLEPQDVDFPADLDERVLCGVTGDFVKQVLPYVQADVNCLAVNFISVAASVIGRRVYATFGPDEHCAGGININNIGTTGVGKGTANAAAIRMMKLVDPGWSLRSVRTGCASGEALIRMLSEVSAVPSLDDDDDDSPNLYSQGRLLLNYTELATLFNSASRQGSILSAKIREAYDGTMLQNPRADAEKSYSAEDYVLTVNGSCTPRELTEVMPNIDFSNGSANRFIWNAVRRSKVLTRSVKFPDFEELAGTIKKLLPNTRFRIDFNQAGGELWDKWCLSLPDDDSLVGEAMGRAQANALRLCCTFATLDLRRLGRPNDQFFITTEHVQAATAVVDRSRATIEWYLKRPMLIDDKKAPFEDVVKFRTALNLANGELPATELYALFKHKTPEQRAEIASRAGAKLRAGRANGKRGPAPQVWAW